jgi:hypothetical protein
MAFTSLAATGNPARSSSRARRSGQPDRSPGDHQIAAPAGSGGRRISPAKRGGNDRRSHSTSKSHEKPCWSHDVGHARAIQVSMIGPSGVHDRAIRGSMIGPSGGPSAGHAGATTIVVTPAGTAAVADVVTSLSARSDARAVVRRAAADACGSAGEISLASSVKSSSPGEAPTAALSPRHAAQAFGRSNARHSTANAPEEPAVKLFPRARSRADRRGGAWAGETRTRGAVSSAV